MEGSLEGRGNRKRSQYSFWIRPQHENAYSKWIYYWSHIHQSRGDRETLWPNLQLLSLLLLNVIWGCAARPGYFPSWEFYKYDENGLGFPNPWSLYWVCTTEVSRRAWAGSVALLDNNSAEPQKVRRHQLEQKMASQPWACNSEKKERSISLIQIFSFDSSSWCCL